MISWFSDDRIRGYLKLPRRKLDRIKKDLDEKIYDQKTNLDNRMSFAKDFARKADRMLKRGKESKAKEEMKNFELELTSSQPVLSAYVRSSLERSLLDVMSMEGFVLPDVLDELVDGIDYGLFSCNPTDELEAILSKEVDPLRDLGIEI
ncbi:MAG: hypothetical protein CMB66_02110 [Euryarchaeota archaeon]|nr:hypothetical protein [Euryarchaeota archaeon]|tara:strand:+ start:43 stop:489 length:447 start_codon:yes stop_codon:yes gene_type:complete